MSSKRGADGDVLNVLRSSIETHEVVRVVRHDADWDDIDGAVIAVGPTWFLLQLIDWDTTLNGYAALPISGVARIELRGGGGPQSFFSRALRYFGQTPKYPEGVDLSSPQAILSTAAETFGLVTIHPERLDPDICYVGKPVGAIANHLVLHEISPKAEWDPEGETSTWKIDEITRIEFGGRYGEALLALGNGMAVS